MKKMKRSNDGKPQLSYVFDFPIAMAEFSKLMEAGAVKYDRDNWKDGGPVREMLDSMLRHISAYANCEDIDEETQCNHMAAVMFGAAGIMEHMERFGGTFDNRDWERVE